MDQLMQMGGFLESWQTELQEVLASLSSEHQRQRTTRKKRFHFRLQNCIDDCQETNRLSYMSLPKNVIINIPIVASAVSEVPLDKENAFFEVEVLAMSEQGTIVIGAVSKEFQPGHQPGTVPHSIGYSIADGSFRDSCAVSSDANAVCKVGDKVGCGLDIKEDNKEIIYFTKNGNKVFECVLTAADADDGPSPSGDLLLRFPAISMTTPKEEVRLLQDAPWRSATHASSSNEGLRLCRETGQLSFRSTKEGGREMTLLANLPFSKQFAYFEIEIRALGDEDEIGLGGVPDDYSLRKLPGRRPRSLGYHGRVGGIFPGLDVKRDDAPKCSVGDKMGCGIEFRANGKRHLYFTHNSKSFMEAELNENCPLNLYPAIGMQSHGGTVCVCLLECSKWGSADDDAGMKPVQLDMKSQVDSELGVVVVDKETARASYTAPVGVTRDAILVSSTSLAMDGGCSYFEIEILYGNIVTIGVVPRDAAEAVTAHPGWTDTSIGYHAESGQVYSGGETLETRQMKSTYGDRIGCGIKRNSDEDNDTNRLIVYFKKNGAVMCELPFGDIGTEFCPAIGMRSAGQVLSIRLLDRPLWSCDVVKPDMSNKIPGLTPELLDRELIECPICRDIFTNPKILPCSLHSFCEDCLRRYIEQHQGKRSVPCPICQKLFVVPSGGVNELPTNPLITRLLEIRSKLEGN